MNGISDSRNVGLLDCEAVIKVQINDRRPIELVVFESGSIVFVFPGHRSDCR